MDYNKQGNSSEASSDENEHNSPEKINDAIGTSRSYECSFCKRGFTNAQALGGHMNIHRKDKAKIKSKQRCTKSASVSTKFFFNEDDYMSSSRFLAPNYVANEQAQYHAHATFGAQINDQQFHFDPMPKLNPSYGPHAFFHSSLISTIHDHVDDIGSNLNFEVGSSRIEDDKVNNNRRNNVIEGDVDLELRLGYDP